MRPPTGGAGRSATPASSPAAGRPTILPPAPFAPRPPAGSTPGGSVSAPRPSSLPPTAPSALSGSNPAFPSPSRNTPPFAPSAPFAPTPRSTTPAAPAPAAPQGGPRATPTARPPINPFLANDPNAKAKRLARALVSDIVTYFPQKREEGVRDGTLKQLFRDEIKKSYEEYVEQIGREFAESTTHFQDALNDVLAGGKKLF
jgi:hypothetical protein